MTGDQTDNVESEHFTDSELSSDENQECRVQPEDPSTVIPIKEMIEAKTPTA